MQTAIEKVDHRLKDMQTTIEKVDHRLKDIFYKWKASVLQLNKQEIK